jgi:hypothetical protein
MGVARMMECKATTVFNFTGIFVGGIGNYNFQIPAENRDDACRKLITALEAVITDISSMMKSGTKAS